MGTRRGGLETVSSGLFDTRLSRYAGKSVLVTGHTGFKGSWLSLWLSELGARVTGYALEPQNCHSHFSELGLADRIAHRIGDVRNREALQEVMDEAQPEIVFHLAAQAFVRRSYIDPLETFTTNVSGGANLLDAVRHTDSVRSLVFITSDKCYENKEWEWGYRETDELGGRDPYSASKAAVELVFGSFHRSYFSNRANFGCATARAGNVIGGGDWSTDRLVPDSIRALEKCEPIIIRNPTSTRPWQFVLDPLAGYLELGLALLDAPKKFAGAWNFGPSSRGFMTVEDVVSELIARWGSGVIRKEVDPNAMHEANLLHLSIDKALSHLAWRPTYAAREAIAATVDWYKQRHNGAPVSDLSIQQVKIFEAVRSRSD